MHHEQQPPATNQRTVEHEPAHAPQPMPSYEHQSKPRLATENNAPDWRRFDVALARYRDRIQAGIDEAENDGSSLAEEPARCIAHVLSRSLSPSSALADYARTSNGYYETLRDEYLALYDDPGATEEARSLIAHLGTSLIYETYPDIDPRNTGAPYPARFEDLLVPTPILIDSDSYVIHVPATHDGAAIAALAETFARTTLDHNPAFQAWLSLPQVNAADLRSVEQFDFKFIGAWTDINEVLEEVYELDERANEVIDFAADRWIKVEDLTPDYETLRRETSADLDIVEIKGIHYVFQK